VGSLAPIPEKVEAEVKVEGEMITVRLFGMTKSLAGNQDSLSLALSNGQKVKDLVELLGVGYPMIGELIHKKKILVSVNQEIAHEETDIREGDEVALLPPFAGGTPQDVETGRQLRSRVAQRFNVPKRTPHLLARCGLAGRPV
jgi:molybdopterin converting factor small subunit